MKNISNKIESILLNISASLFFLVFAVGSIEIIMRGVFGFSLLWTIDLSMLLASWSILLSGAVLIKRNEHLVVDFIANMLSKKYKMILSLLTRFILLSLVIVLAYNGIIVTNIRMGLYYPTLRWPTGYAYAALPVFGFFSIFFLIEKIINIFKQIVGKTE